MQPTGSFKLRGAFLGDQRGCPLEQRALRGVVAHYSGKTKGLAVGYRARGLLGVRAVWSAE